MSRPPVGPGRPLKARLALAGLLLVPLIEIVVFVLVARAIGVWWALLALVAVSVLGAALVRRQWGASWASLQNALRSGRMPADEIADTALLACGGLLMLVPGFVTGVLGLLLVIPVTRFLGRRLLAFLVARRAWVTVVGEPRTWRDDSTPGAAGGHVRGDAADEIVEGEIVDDDQDDRE